MPHSYRMTSMVLHSAQCAYHTQHYTLQAFEQFGALYMNNLDNKHPTRTGFLMIQFKHCVYPEITVNLVIRADKESEGAGALVKSGGGGGLTFYIFL